MRLMMGLLAGFTSAIALILFVHTLLVPEGSAGWIAWKLGSTAFVVTQGALTLRSLLWRGAVAAFARMMQAGAVALVPIGAAYVAVTVHLARVTGDWEMYAIAAGLAMIAQGLLTGWIVSGLRLEV